MRGFIAFLILAILKIASRLLYRFDVGWVGEVPEDPWQGHRVVAILNHTSLFEFIFAGAPPFGFLWRSAFHGVVPVADKTFDRPFAGQFYRLLTRNVVSISRERDHTWDEIVRRVGEDSMVMILPEGRMMRADGYDNAGRPMTMRGGIADLLHATRSGRMLLAYSGGLHHVQRPGERLPRLFKTVRIRFEVIDIEAYCQSLGTGADARAFKRAVVRDLERRRDEVAYGQLARDGSTPEVAFEIAERRRREEAASPRRESASAAG